MIKNHCSNNKASVFAKDLMNRFKFVIHRSLEFIIFPPFVVPQDETFHFVCKLFVILIDAVSDMVAKFNSVYHQVNVFLRKQTVYLLLWMLSPSKPTYMRMFAVRKLHFDPNLKKILVNLFHSDTEAENKFAVFVWQLTFSNSHKLSNSELFLCEKFIQRLRHVRILSACVLEKTEKIWFLEVQTKIREMTIAFWERQKSYFDTLAAFVKNYSKIIQMESDAKLKNGFVFSANIVQRLGAQNRKYLYDANVKNCIRVEIKMSWMKIIEQFTHERGPWFVRLRPFNFWTHESDSPLNEADESSTSERNAGKKLLIQKCLQQIDFTHEKRLSYLFDECEPNANVLSYIFMKDVISDTFNTIKIHCGAEIDGEILIGEKDIYFIPARDNHHTKYFSDFSIPFDSIDEVFYRTYKSKDQCVEMFLSNGNAEFFYFFSEEKRNEFIGILKNHISSKRIICCCILDIFIRRWAAGLVTNWEYLHILNKLAGRSYNDFMQYPLMPLVLADYNGETIDLAQPNIYRNLRRLSSVREVSKEFKTSSHNLNVFGYSTFTSNLFCGSKNDAAISEYFDVPEIMGYVYTQRKNNEAVIKNIKLPTWARNSHRLFALVYRQLLESHHIRKNLSHWIDLAFGFKQVPDFVKKPQSSSCRHLKTGCRMKNPLFTSPHPLPSDKNLKDDSNCCKIPVISGVRSIKWGHFVGSPLRNPPSMVSRRYFSLPIVAFIPLITNSVHIAFAKTAPLFFYDYEQVLETGQKNRIQVSRMFLLHWNCNNGVISVRENHIHRPIAFCPPRDPITVFSVTPDYCNIWVGLSSGTIFVFKLLFDNSSVLTNTHQNPSVLLGHSDKISGICLSRSFGIAVSISKDKSVILWDLNKIIYIRSINGWEFPLNIVAISDTSGDIATVGYDVLNSRSLLKMHTMDGVLIGSICSSERITAVCFSSVPEGIFVNVIATALQTGVIRIWNTWDLSAVCEFSTTSTSPITRLTYSFDAEYFYAASEDGYVTVWKSSMRSHSKNNCGLI